MRFYFFSKKAGWLKMLALAALITGVYQQSHAQRAYFNGVFAPDEYNTTKQEQPYRERICINGLWDFQPVVLPDKFREGIDPVPALTAAGESKWNATKIRIPSPWNVNSFADKNGQGGDFRNYPSYPKEWESVKMGWLRKKIKIPATWRSQKIRLHFEAVAGDAEIMVNGRSAGHHFGIFLPFDIDISELVIPGAENEILIGVRKPSLFDKRGDYGRRNYQAGSFWGQHIAGIWQDVFVEALPAVSVSDVFIQPKVDSGKLVAAITLTNQSGKAVTATVNAIAKPWKGSAVSLSLKPVTVKIPANSTVTATIAADVKNQLKYWTPQQPNLYDLVTQVSINSKTTDKKINRFGWRQLAIKGSKIYLNNEEITLRGDSWHFLGIPQMTRRYAQAWYTAMRDAGLNAVRLHAQPYPSFYLDVADEMGILVLDETAMWASDGGPKLDDPAYWQDSKTHLEELILRDRNHPSVFGWSVSNEIMPIVRGVMRNPPGMKDTLVKYYHEWAATCRRLDPSRAWISADGEDDGEGTFPVYIVHYGGFDAMKRGENSGKPWGVGEAGNAYYGTPEQVAETNGNRAYESFLGRMEGVAASSYQSLAAQQERHGIYQSVFNLVWYGLKPLALGMKDTTRAPTLEDGIYFPLFKEGQPGVQPERIGPYSTTLNPGYDKSLPLYQTWPLFDAIKDASNHTGADKWKPAKTNTTEQSFNSNTVLPLKIISGNGGKLASQLKRTGVLVDAKDSTSVPQLLFIDGETPPADREWIDKTLAQGGTVIVWGVNAATLPALNRLLPSPLSVETKISSSLLVNGASVVTRGLNASDLYFAELRPPEIITQSLSGALVKESNVLLNACRTDWLRWNKQPEYAKTAMILRSEREATGSDAVLIEKITGKGRLIITTLPAAPRLAKAEKVIRRILANLQVPLGPGSDVGKPLLKGGDIVRALVLGNFPASSIKDGLSLNIVNPSSGDHIRSGSTVEGKQWKPVFEESALIDFSKLKTDGPKNNAVAYLSFWVSSPRDLSDLLIEPNIPVVNLEISADDAAQVWLNGNSIINTTNGGSSKAAALKLNQGWNHFLIKVIQTGGGWQFSGRLTSNQPDFIADLESALEKP
jgi:hypothetical protein